MKINIAKATLNFSEHFEESVQEMINDGMLKTEQEIKDYIVGCLIEDIELEARQGGIDASDIDCVIDFENLDKEVAIPEPEEMATHYQDEIGAWHDGLDQ